MAILQFPNMDAPRRWFANRCTFVPITAPGYGTVAFLTAGFVTIGLGPISASILLFVGGAKQGEARCLMKTRNGI